MALQLASGTLRIVAALSGHATMVLRPRGAIKANLRFNGTLRRSPRVASCEPRSARLIRVTFDRPMNNDSRLSSIANYSFTPTGAGVGIYVRRVTPQSATYPLWVDVEVTEMTQGLGYVGAVMGGVGGPGDRYGFNMNSSGLEDTFSGVGEAPTLFRASAISRNRVDVKFSEPMLDNPDIRDIARYIFDNGLAVLSVLAVVADTVQLVTSDQTPGTLYTITIT